MSLNADSASPSYTRAYTISFTPIVFVLNASAVGWVGGWTYRLVCLAATEQGLHIARR